MNDALWTMDCCARHMGDWAMKPGYLEASLQAMKMGVYEPWRARDPGPRRLIAMAPTEGGRQLYVVDGNGIALISISGPLMKGAGKLGEADSLAARRAIAAAARDEDVKAIQLMIDSPGGTVAGTEELAAAVADAGKIKPVSAHIDDLGASAAYWVAAQAGYVTANQTAEVGSIGVFTVLSDSSGAAKAEGISIRVISSGPFKGAGFPGTEVSQAQIDDAQKRVDEMAALMVQAISKGRGRSPKTVQGWADGRIWGADEALAMGLIDGVMRIDRALEDTRRAAKGRQNRAALRHARLSAAKNYS